MSLINIIGTGAYTVSTVDVIASVITSFHVGVRGNLFCYLSRLLHYNARYYVLPCRRREIYFIYLDYYTITI